MLLLGTDESHSIFSVLKAAHSNGKGILGFFNTSEAKILRKLNREALLEVTNFKWNDNPTLNLENAKIWWKSFPNAKSLSLKYNRLHYLQNIDDHPSFMKDLDFEGLETLTNWNYNIRTYPSTLKKLYNYYDYCDLFEAREEIAKVPYPMLETLEQDIVLQPLPPSLKHFTSREYVFENNNIPFVSLDLMWNYQINMGMINLKALQTLIISETRLEDKDLENVPSSLKHLEIACTMISDYGIRRFKSLKYLDVQWCNNITYQGVHAILHENLKLKANGCGEALELLEKILR